ncbi:MAG: flavocytochrome c [Treponema sp.]|nr:flavocytochrome c [Treponema sp.]MBQ9538175.1 flavocytochrome c [Treponema sp.]
MNKKPFFIIVPTFLVLAAIAIVIGVKARPAGETYNDGVWTASAAGRNGPINLSLTVQGGKVVSGEIVSEEETDFAKPAEQKIIDQFLKTKSVDKLDTVSGATITSKATISAISMALALAKGEASSAPASALADESCDIVVIGAGGAGLCAATEASSKGAHVILLEKMGIAGGNTNSATGGLNASETKIQAGLGITDSNEQYYQDTMKGGYNLNDPDLVRNMVEKSSETVDWLISLGADLSDVGKMAGSTNSRTHRPQGGAAIGVHLVPVLEKAAKDAGVEIRYNSIVTDIIEENGKAVGVNVSSTNGGSYVVKAEAVIIATGGFGANPDMVVKYKEDLAGFGTTNHKGATGDAFAWVQKFDAELVQMDQIQTHPTVVPSNGLMITEAVRGNGAIMVNREGKRFGNEMATRDVMSADVLAQTGKTAYLLFDQSVRESLKAIEGYAKKGLLTEGATPAELAGKLGMDAAALTATINTYNGYQKSGSGDPDFGRKANEMPRALDKGPYYAVEVGPAIHHTMGGIKINTKAQVINKSGGVVPGLFAAGEVTGGVHGGNRLGGNAVADICVYGKIAGDSALAYIGK